MFCRGAAKTADWGAERRDRDFILSDIDSRSSLGAMGMALLANQFLWNVFSDLALVSGIVKG